LSPPVNHAIGIPDTYGANRASDAEQVFAAILVQPDEVAAIIAFLPWRS
jgi:hypothetical protein